MLCLFLLYMASNLENQLLAKYISKSPTPSHSRAPGAMQSSEALPARSASSLLNYVYGCRAESVSNVSAFLIYFFSDGEIVLQGSCKQS